MPFRLTNIGPCYQTLMARVFSKQTGKNLEVYFDDIIKSNEGIVWETWKVSNFPDILHIPLRKSHLKKMIPFRGASQVKPRSSGLGWPEPEILKLRIFRSMPSPNYSPDQVKRTR